MKHIFTRRPSTGAGQRYASANHFISGRETLRVRVEMSFRGKKYLPVLKQQREYIRKVTVSLSIT